jgi:hypothetical protein
LSDYRKNSYRDTANIQKYPGACDIYSLGHMLLRLIHLYMNFWHPQEKD